MKAAVFPGVCLALIVMLIPFPALASLGGNAASIEADRAHIKGALEIRHFQLDNQYADLRRSQIFDRVRRQWLHPLSAGNPRRFTCQPAIEENIATLVAPDEMTPTLDIGDSAPTVGMNRYDGTRRNRCAQHTHAFVFQQHGMMLGRRDRGVERIRPRPAIG